MSAFHARRDEDVAKLKELERRTEGRIRLARVSGNPVSEIQLTFRVRTPANEKYPAHAIDEVHASVQLGARYPFDEPTVSLSTKVFNPNVYTSGRVCLGAKWLPTEFLDLLAQRLFKILSYDESIVNTASAANGEAARWYLKAKRQHAKDFPTDRLVEAPVHEKPSIKWTDKSPAATGSASNTRVVVPCPSCKTNLRLPAGKAGSVSCPKCAHVFPMST